MQETVLIGLVAFLLIIYILTRVIRVVPEYERLVILALGRYAGTRGPGIVIVIPLLETAVKVDMRERFLDIPAQTAITQDNAPIAIDFLVYYRITDPKRAVLEVDNVVSASLNIATTTLRAVIGDIELDVVLSKREQINDTLRVKLDEITERWGLKITSVEIREIQPPDEVQDAMNRQMTAERERRAAVTRASGEREAEVMRAEGAKTAAILKAEGDREAEILRAEGAKQSSILEAEAEQQSQALRAAGFSEALQHIHAVANTLDDRTMLLQYLEALKDVGSSPSTKFIVPMEVTNLMRQFTDTLSLNSQNGDRPPAQPAPRPVSRQQPEGGNPSAPPTQRT